MRSYDRRLAPLIDVFKFKETQRVLEVGCGFGHDLIWTAQAGGGRAVGIDVNSAFVDIARRTKASVEKHIGRSIDVDIRRCNLLDMSLDEQSGLIYMKDTFHHLEPRDEVVARLSALLGPGGTIVIVEPNAWNPLIQLQMFRIRGFRTVVEKTDSATGARFIFGNERLVTGVRLRSLFKRRGIHGLSKTIRFLPTKLSRQSLLVRIALLLERMHLEPLLCPACIHTIYVGRKE
ncbi:MAG: class I SAM-dependent methyltransferase [Rhodoferax sp.]|nr:class I SAM-dependent methyltransferase [Rhodoferax sp.]